MIIFKQSVI